jgi:hypothetical protein
MNKNKEKVKKAMENIQKRLKEIKKSIEDENISYGEIAELQSLRKYIKDDTVLMEWAGIKEGTK